MNLAAVFEIENDLPNDSAAAECGHGGVEINLAMRAVRAIERVCDRARERFRAFRAKRRNDARDFRFAFTAKIFARLDIVRANGAHRWIEERCQRA